jgi:SAM-dependent methyltransferase
MQVTAAPPENQSKLNADFWARGECLNFYATRELRPVERVLLERFGGALAGRVLELGCGAGRLTGHLIEVAREVHGVDVSPTMIAYCERTYPGGIFHVRDLRDLSGLSPGSYDAVVAPYNALDVLDDAERRRVLDDIRGLLADGGLLIMSSHNRAYVPLIGDRARLLLGDPRRPLRSARRLALRFRNRRRLRPLERSESEYAVINDSAHDFAVLHYYVSRDAQARQLAAHGFQMLQCLDLDGREVGPGASARRCPELHYVARAARRTHEGERALAASA